MKAIVLAGGGGARLWPLSREEYPKQFLNFGAGPSLLQMTIRRLLNASFIDELIIATNIHHKHLIEQHIHEIGGMDKVRILVEPLRKNTAPAIGLAVKHLQECCEAKESEIVLVLPSDHLIEPESVFLHSLEQMEDIARGNRMITFGIRPTRPETGFGYIQIGKKQNGFTFEAARFVEKPDQKTAEQYIQDPRFYWNAGIFVFSIRTFWQQMQEHSPQLFGMFQRDFNEIVNQFSRMPDLSIDYAIMEKSRKVLLCPLAVSWSDVGSWDSVYEVMEKDSNQNVKIGHVLDIDTKNSLIIGKKKLVSTIDLEDMLIIETEEAVFVSKKGESQRVKALVQELVQRGQKLESAKRQAFFQVLDQNDEWAIKKIRLLPGQTINYMNPDELQEQWSALQKGAQVNGSISLLPNSPFFPGNLKEFTISNPSTSSVDLIVIQWLK